MNQKSTDALVATCAGPLFAVTAALLTASLALNLAACPTVPFAVVQIPLALICLGMWVTFVAALIGRAGKGPGIAQSGLTIALIACVIPFFLPWILGFVVWTFGQEEGSNSLILQGFCIVVVSVVVMALVVMFWNKLRHAAMAVGGHLRGGQDPWPRMLYSEVLLVVFAVGLCLLPSAFGDVIGLLREAVAFVSEHGVPLVEEGFPKAATILAQVDALLATLPATLTGLALAACLVSAASLVSASALLVQMSLAARSQGPEPAPAEPAPSQTSASGQ